MNDREGMQRSSVQENNIQHPKSGGSILEMINIR